MIVAKIALVAALAGGAFMFGAVYPWAYWPMLGVALIAALLGLGRRAPAIRRVESPALAAALVAFVVGVALQLVPLSLQVLGAISPEAPGIMRQYDAGIAAGVATTHPLSLSPSSTGRGLMVTAALVGIFIGATRLFSLIGTRWLARAIAVLGALLAIEGIVQRALSLKVYGFWQPLYGGNPFGPFINKNHFAGWMLMALPLTFGLAGGAAARGARLPSHGIRDRVLWLSSPEGARLLQWFGAAALMAVSLILTMSRSGMAAAVLIVTAFAVRVWRAQGSVSRRIVAAGMICAAGAGIAVWAGADRIEARFQEAQPELVNLRTGAWLDALDIARRYPVAGTGFNTYGIATLFYQRHDLSLHYEQAHNDYLQLAAEGGLLLVAPAAACVLLFGRAVARRFAEETSTTTAWLRFGALTGIGAIAAQEFVDFSLQMPANALLFTVLCAVAIHRSPVRPRRTP